MKETERLSAVNSIQSKCLKFASSCLNSSAHWVNMLENVFWCADSSRIQDLFQSAL